MATKKTTSKYEWDFREIFETQKDFEKGIKKLKTITNKMDSYKDTLAKADKTTYLKFYDLSLKHQELYEKLSVYSHKFAVQMNDPVSLENKSKIQILEQEVSLQHVWIPNAIRKLGEKKILQYVQSSKKHAHLTHSVKNYFRIDKFHLKPNEEKFISSFKTLFETPSEIYTQMAFADKKFPEIKYKNKTVKLTSSVLSEIFSRTNVKEDQDLRQRAAHLNALPYANYENTYNSLYESLIKTDMTIAKMKGFKSALHSGLHYENVPEEVYLNFISNAYDNSRLLYDYYQIHRKEIKSRGAKYYYRTDRTIPIEALGKNDFKFGVDEALDLCMEALKPLGKEYNDQLKEAAKPGRIDYYEREGKNNGGFSMSTPFTEAYILMNWSDDYVSLITLIHELGHSTHSKLATKNQKKEYASYTILVAEVASTFCELMLADHMLKTFKKRNLQIFLLQWIIRRFETLYFSTAKEANFEYKAKQAAFEGKPTNKTFLQKLAMDIEFKEKIFDSSKKEYFSLTPDKTWPSILHHYTTFFYLYKYALSYVVACNLFLDYLETGNTENFVNLLKAGGSDYSLNLIKKHTNVDLKDINSHKKLFELMEKYVSKLRDLVN